MRREFSFEDADVAPGPLSATVDDEIDARGYTFEGQHLLTTEELDLVSGVGYFTRDSDRTRISSTVTGDGASIGAPGGAVENFWILDYALGYRLPRHYGIVSLNVQNLLNEEFSFQDRNFFTDEPDLLYP